MAIRVFGRVLFSGFALPKEEFNEARFLPSPPAFFAPESQNPRSSLGPLASRGVKPLRSKYARGRIAEPKAAPGKHSSTWGPRKNLRRTVLFGIPAFVILGDWVFAVKLDTVVLALGFSLLVGVVFGVWPARTAAKLEPIDALRFE